jgi:hypothetical protein
MELTSAGDETSCRVGNNALKADFDADCDSEQEHSHDKPESAGILSHPT